MLRSTWRGLETWHGRDAVTPRNRKGEATGNTNFDLKRRASSRPYLRGAGGETPPAYSPQTSSVGLPSIQFEAVPDPQATSRTSALCDAAIGLVLACDI